METSNKGSFEMNKSKGLSVKSYLGFWSRGLLVAPTRVGRIPDTEVMGKCYEEQSKMHILFLHTLAYNIHKCIFTKHRVAIKPSVVPPIGPFCWAQFHSLISFQNAHMHTVALIHWGKQCLYSQQ